MERSGIGTRGRRSVRLPRVRIVDRHSPRPLAAPTKRPTLLQFDRSCRREPRSTPSESSHVFKAEGFWGSIRGLSRFAPEVVEVDKFCRYAGVRGSDLGLLASSTSTPGTRRSAATGSRFATLIPQRRDLASSTIFLASLRHTRTPPWMRPRVTPAFHSRSSTGSRSSRSPSQTAPPRTSPGSAPAPGRPRRAPQKCGLLRLGRRGEEPTRIPRA